MKMKILFPLSLSVLLVACVPYANRYIHDQPLMALEVPAVPDYQQEQNWAALPSRADEADGVAEGSAYPEAQASAAADVFFIYPTLYTDDPKGRYPWNASVNDEELNKKISESTIRLQASIFNAAGKVYVPRYRQAHLSAYYTDDKAKAKEAFDLAYADVRAAFEVFLRKYNNERPILIASHSQGTTMAKRLLQEYFDAKPLADRLVAAYLIGIPVEPDFFSAIPICQDATQTGCYVSWRTWQRPATPWGKKAVPQPEPVVVNPLTWTTDTSYASAQLNSGGILRKLDLIEHISDAQVHEGVLWINRPDFFGKRFITMDNWHIADLGLFYESIRANAIARVEAFVAQ